MPYMSSPPRARSRGGFRRRGPRPNWQWSRQTSNDTAIITAPGHYQEDLLAVFKTEFGFSVNFPDIVIWRILLRISITIRFLAAITNAEAYGAIVGVFVDDNSFTLQGVETHPYMEKYLLYAPMYYNEAVMLGEAPAAANQNGVLVREFDIKAHRRLGNIEDTLILQVGTTGGITSFQGLSYSTSTLIKMGRR